MRDGFLHGMPIIRRTAVGTGLRLKRTHAAERLKIGERIITAVHRHQQFPIAFGAALQHHTAKGVALDAGRFGVLVSRVLVLDHAPLGFEQRRPRLFRRQSEIVGQILEISRAWAGSSCTPFRTTMRLMVCSQPSGVVRR